MGRPWVGKPVMSSSGKGQSLVRRIDEAAAAWDYAQSGGRAGRGRAIVEGFVPFEYEITLLTVRHRDGTTFCEPIGHYQEDGDYRESWQPQPMSPSALARSQEIARAITDALGGWGIFGVELFVRGDEVWFSEVSPRPHDTGLVTLASQELSQFALHVRAILGLPIPAIRTGIDTGQSWTRAKPSAISSSIMSGKTAHGTMPASAAGRCLHPMAPSSDIEAPGGTSPAKSKPKPRSTAPTPCWMRYAKSRVDTSRAPKRRPPANRC
jgi:phosphoribosylglycinamide formyltransferase 2